MFEGRLKQEAHRRRKVCEQKGTESNQDDSDNCDEFHGHLLLA